MREPNLSFHASSRNPHMFSFFPLRFAFCESGLTDISWNYIENMTGQILFTQKSSFEIEHLNVTTLGISQNTKTFCLAKFTSFKLRLGQNSDSQFFFDESSFKLNFEANEKEETDQSISYVTSSSKKSEEKFFVLIYPWKIGKRCLSSECEEAIGRQGKVLFWTCRNVKKARTSFRAVDDWQICSMLASTGHKNRMDDKRTFVDVSEITLNGSDRNRSDEQCNT